MSFYLVDTSAWIEVFRRKQPLDLEKVVNFNHVVTCLPVVQEVVQGFRQEAAFRKVRKAMLALPMVESPLGRDVFDEAVAMYRLARRNGLTIRSSVDCLIAACAIRNDLCVLHRDRDFAALSRVTKLEQERL